MVLNARSRFLDLTGSIRLYYVLAFGAFVSMLSFILYKDFIIVGSMIGCTIGSFFLLSRPPKSINVAIAEDSLIIGDSSIDWSICLGWAMVDLGDMLEFVVHTSNLSHQFYYFYLKEDELGIQDFILALSEYTPYDENIPKQNLIHNTLREWGLK